MPPSASPTSGEDWSGRGSADRGAGLNGVRETEGMIPRLPAQSTAPHKQYGSCADHGDGRDAGHERPPGKNRMIWRGRSRLADVNFCATKTNC